MLKSMTGFGRCDELIEGFSVQIQIKSVNHRYSDFTIKTPRHYAFLEEPLRALAASKIARGKVEILLSIDKQESDDKKISLDTPVALGYIDALRAMKEYGLTDDLTLSSMARFSDIFHIEYEKTDEEELLKIVTIAFEKALQEFIDMRQSEGVRLESSLRQHLQALQNEIEIIEKLSPECVNAYRERLFSKIKDVLDGAIPDENRILTEAAIFADKVAVDEETVRLRSHIKAFEDAMNTEHPIGKKLDFIVQEMNRESNTIGSKCNDFAIAEHVVEMKSLIEKIREQIQNIE